MLTISFAFLRADDGSVADIFRNTIGLPRYHDPLNVSGIVFNNITIGINNTVEKL